MSVLIENSLTPALAFVPVPAPELELELELELDEEEPVEELELVPVSNDPNPEELAPEEPLFDDCAFAVPHASVPRIKTDATLIVKRIIEESWFPRNDIACDRP